MPFFLLLFFLPPSEFSFCSSLFFGRLAKVTVLQDLGVRLRPIVLCCSSVFGRLELGGTVFREPSVFLVCVCVCVCGVSDLP